MHRRLSTSTFALSLSPRDNASAGHMSTQALHLTHALARNTGFLVAASAARLPTKFGMGPKILVLGGILIGFSGAVGGSFLSFGPGKDFEILTFALVVVIIGGLGSVAGSAAGALVVGLVDSFGRSYFSELAIFLLSGTLLVVLAFRPQGLFGRREQ